jgi:sugar phosphate isomerase/epimerase
MPRLHYAHDLTNYLHRDSYNRAVPVGEGFIDYESFIGTLKEIGYQGYVGYEMCAELAGGGSLENLDRTAREFLDYISNF